MSQIIRKSTEIKIRLGPAMAIADGVTPVTGLTIAAADQAEVLKADGATTVAMTGTLAAVSGCDGYYDYTVQTTDSDAVGTIEIVLQDASASLPLKWIGQVLAAVAFDTLYAAAPTIITPADIGLMYESDIATVTAEDELIMTLAFPVDDAWIGNVCSLFDASSSKTYSAKNGVGIWISDVLQSTNTLKLSSVFPVALAVGDIIRIHTAMHPRYTIELFAPPTRAEATTDKNAILTQITDIFTTQMTEAYAADGVAPTPAQALMLIQQLLGDFMIAGTTLTVRKIDGATTAAAFTLDDSTNPTDITRAT